MTFTFINRIWRFGWANPQPYYKPSWIFHFNYYKNIVWQVMLLGVYITSTNINSIRG